MYQALKAPGVCRFFVFGIVVVLLLIQAVYSAEGITVEGEEDLGEDVVEGERKPSILWTARENIDTLYSFDLHERKQVRTIPEALKEIPGISIQKTSHGQGSPYIRGFTGFRTLLLIDGIRVNNSVFRSGPNQYWNTVDPYSIDSLEIAKGTGGVLYGSDAIGGAVNAVTKGVGRYDSSGVGFHPGLTYRYAGAEDSHIGRVESSFSWKEQVGFFGGFTIKDFGDLRGGRDVGVQDETGYEEWDGDVKLETFLSEDSRFVFAFQRVRLDNAWRTHKTVEGISWEGTGVGSETKRIFDQERTLAYLQFHATNLDGIVDAVSSSISYQNQNEERHRIRPGKDPDREGFDVDTFGAWLRLQSDSPVGTWTYGGEYYLDWVDSYKKTYPGGGVVNEAVQGPVGDNSRYHLLGVYVQDRVPVVKDHVDVILGGRYTYARADVGQYKDPQSGNSLSLDDDWDSVVGSAQVFYAIDKEKHWNLFAGVSQGFRTPNLSDLTRSAEARTNEYEIAAPGLDPEQYICYEGGLRTQWENASAEVSYFYYDIDDMIMRTPTGNVDGDGNLEVTKLNSGAGYVHGVELGGSWEFWKPFTFFGNFTWLDGEVDTYPIAGSDEKKSEPISRLMPAISNLGVRWDHESRKWWVETLLTIAGEANELSTRDAGDTQRIPPGGTPRYTVLTIRSGWQITDQVRLSAAIENITDEDYRIHGSGLNEPGTNGVLSLDVRF